MVWVLADLSLPVGLAGRNRGNLINARGEANGIDELRRSLHRSRLGSFLLHMKLKSAVIRRSLVGVACLSFVLGAAARAADTPTASRNSEQQWQSTVKPKIILVDVTGSRIPQRVVLHGQQVNSGSPLFIIGGNELLRSGSTSVTGILRMDPSISFAKRQ